ncbi:MAG: hypothetical protein AB1441_00865 [Bacillota bacterium]
MLAVRREQWGPEIRRAKAALAAGQVDRDTLVLAHLPLAIKMGARAAKQHFAVGWTEDYIQEAVLALLTAAEQYLRGQRDQAFDQYAATVIYLQLTRLMRTTHLVNIPVTTYWSLREVFPLAERYGDELTAEIIAAELGVSQHRARELFAAWCFKKMIPTSLDAVVDGTAGITVEETLAGPDDVEGEVLEAITQEEREELWRAVQDLRPVEQATVCLNFGVVDHFEGASIADVEAAACVSRQHRVRRKIAKLFREEQRDARKLGFLPTDATGKLSSGERVVVALSGHR